MEQFYFEIPGMRFRDDIYYESIKGMRMKFDFDAIVISSGFGGSVMTL